MSAKVYLVGAGPGDPELLTRKAWRVLQSADLVLHDDLVSEEIISMLPCGARIRNVGKRCGAKKFSQTEVNEQMISAARAGQIVARLKSGDPLLFGRAGEEMDALRQAGIEFEVIPGVTAVLGAAASARIPLTDRRHASRVVFLTAHRAPEIGLMDERSLTVDVAANRTTSRIPNRIDDTTYVVYMPGNRYAELSSEFEAAGIAASTPCIIISRATTKSETIHRTTVGELAGCPEAISPSLLIIGSVVDVFRSVVDEKATIEEDLSSVLGPEVLSLAMQHPFHNS